MKFDTLAQIRRAEETWVGWQWGRRRKHTANHGTGTTATPTNRDSSIGTRSTLPCLLSLISTSLIATNASLSSAAATQVLLPAPPSDLSFFFFIPILLHTFSPNYHSKLFSKMPVHYPFYTALFYSVNLFWCVYTAFSEGMIDDGYEDVVSVDISSVVVEAMQKKYSNRPQLKCIFRLTFFL